MIIQDDLEADLPGGVDDVVEDLHCIEIGEVLVDGLPVFGLEANLGRNDRRFDHLVRERDANRVVAGIVNAPKDAAVILHLEAAGNHVGGFKAAPVDAAEAHRLTAGGYDAAAFCVPETGFQEAAAPSARARKDRLAHHAEGPPRAFGQRVLRQRAGQQGNDDGEDGSQKKNALTSGLSLGGRRGLILEDRRRRRGGE